MKYIDADKIRAEIERRMVELAKDKYIDLHDTLCRTKELNLLLSFLDTLEEPVSDCNDFDSLFDEFCDAHPDGMTLEECGRFFFSRGFSRGKMVATNDSDLALAQRYLTGYYDGKYEPVSDDLEEAAEKYGSDYPAYNDDQFIAENAFKAGAEWQKAKMMKEGGECL